MHGLLLGLETQHWFIHQTSPTWLEEDSLTLRQRGRFRVWDVFAILIMDVGCTFLCHGVFKRVDDVRPSRLCLN